MPSGHGEVEVQHPEKEGVKSAALFHQTARPNRQLESEREKSKATVKTLVCIRSFTEVKSYHTKPQQCDSLLFSYTI